MVEPKVAMLHAIRIEHGHYLKDEQFSQEHACLTVACEELNESFDEEGG